jgi:hypothetical protein
LRHWSFIYEVPVTISPFTFTYVSDNLVIALDVVDIAFFVVK